MIFKPVVLTIDDDPVALRLARMAIESLGFNSVEMSSGIDGLSYLEKRSPQLILLDIMMPVLDGFEVLEKIMAHPTWRQIPVIMFSALSEEHRVIETLEMGARDYILKPFRLRSVQEKISEVIAAEGGRVPDSGYSAKETAIASQSLPEVVMLVTGDDQLEQQVYSLIRRYELRLLRAQGAIEGLRLLGSSKPDMILMDTDLEVFSSDEFAEKLRQHDTWRSIPLIGLGERRVVSTIIPYGEIKHELVSTMRNLWKTVRRKGRKERSADSRDSSDYRLLIMADLSSREWFQQHIRSGYEVKVVDNSDALIGDILSWQPDYVLLNFSDYGEDVFGILRRCHKTVSNANIPYYLFLDMAADSVPSSRIKRAGFAGIVGSPTGKKSLTDILNETLGVNLWEESTEDSAVIFRRKDVENTLAGREVVRRILTRSKQGKKRFIIDLRALESLTFTEVDYLGQICNYQTRYGIRVCLISTSDPVISTLRTFQETEYVEIFPDITPALNYLSR